MRPQPFAVMWAQHLLIEADPRQTVLREDVDVRVDSVWRPLNLPADWIPRGDFRTMLPSGINGWAVKGYTRPGGSTAIGTHAFAGLLTVTVTESPASPSFGFWFNAEGRPEQAPLNHVGLEAGFGDCDFLDEAMASGSALLLVPAEPVEWVTRLTVQRFAEGSEDEE